MMMQAAPITVQPYPDILKESVIDAIPKLRRLAGDKDARWAWGTNFPCWSWGEDWTRISVTETDYRGQETITKKPESKASLQSVKLPVLQSKLQELSSVERLLITKRLRVRHVMSLRGKKNRFFIKTPNHNLLYTVEEENRWWVGYFCYGLRPLVLRVFNTTGEEVMRIVRPYAFTGRVFPCNLQRIKVYSPPGNLIGSVDQLWSAVKPLYVVKDMLGVIRFKIQGPCVTINCCNEVKFVIKGADDTPVGFASKKWQGIMHALFYSAVTDKFSTSFEVNLSPEDKGLLLAASLLLDYMYFDS